MLKKLMTVLAVFLATLMLFSCQQPDNTPTEKIDPNMPAKIYKVPVLYDIQSLVMSTTIGGMDFYFISSFHEANNGPYLLSFLHTDDPQEERVPVTAERINITDSFYNLEGYVTKENIWDSKPWNKNWIGSLIEISGTDNLYESDETKAKTNNYAGWMAIVPVNPKSDDYLHAKVSDSIYLKYYPDYAYLDGEKNNISTLTGYGTWTIAVNYSSIKSVLPKMSEATQRLIFGKVL